MSTTRESLRQRGYDRDLSDRERICESCGRKVTVGKDGTEYGHDRGNRGRGGRCPERPPEDVVDPLIEGNPDATPP